MSPLKVLRRGYAVVTKSGAAVRKIETLFPGDRIAVLLSGGKAECEVVSVVKRRRNMAKAMTFEEAMQKVGGNCPDVENGEKSLE